MRLILLMLMLTALPVSAHAGTIESAPIGASFERLGDASEPAAVRIVPPSAGQPSFRTGEVLVNLPSNFSPEAIDALARRHRLTHLESHFVGLLGRNLHRWRIADRRSMLEVIFALKRDDGIDAQPNNIYSLQ